MIELRWLKGNWDFGKYKLQSRLSAIKDQWGSASPWIDVPIADDKPNEKNSLEELATRFHTAYHFSINREEMGKFRHLAQIAEEHFKSHDID